MEKKQTYRETVEEYKRSYRYQKHVTVWLKVMGLETMLSDSGNNEKFSLMFQMANEVNSLVLHKRGIDGVRVTCISGCIVISSPYEVRGSFEKVLTVLFMLEQSFLRSGVLLKGALTVGDLYHEGQIVFGPALMEACRLESGCAVYPRCILTRETLQEILKDCRSEARRTAVQNLLRQDDDGFYFFDYLGRSLALLLAQSREGEEPVEVFDELQELKWFLEDKLKETGTAENRIIMKYGWLRNYFNKVVLELEKQTQLDCRIFLVEKPE